MTISLPAITGLNDTSQVRVVLFQSGTMVHTPLTGLATIGDIASLTPADGNFIVGNGTTWVAESGATARTSLGLGTAATQDYEEGTWTPTLQFGGASTGITYSGRDGTYTKIGRLVYWNARVDLSSKGTATGQTTISGLPFVSSDPAANNIVAPSFYNGMSGLSGAIMGRVNGTTVELRMQDAVNNTIMTDANFTNIGILRIAGFYSA